MSSSVGALTTELSKKSSSKPFVKHGLCMLEQVSMLGLVQLLRGGCWGKEHYLSLADYRDGNSAERVTWRRKEQR